MRFRKLGPSGIEASVVALGTWVAGGGSVWGQTPAEDDIIRTIHAALDAGITLIDTAPGYGFGRAETLIGKAIRGRRDKVVIATKCGLVWDAPGVDHFAVDGKVLRRNLHPESIRRECEQSLQRLGVDQIDLYQTHWPEADKTPISETMECLVSLKDEGKIGAIGVCNVTPDELKENLAAGPVCSDQLRYSLLWRSAENDVLPVCRQNALATLAYQPLEQGLLTGKVTMQTSYGPSDIRSHEGWNPWFTPDKRRAVLKMLDGWKPLATKYRCTLAQLVVACTAAQDGITHVLCGARRPEQARENAAAGDLNLDPVDVQRMTDESRLLNRTA